MGEYDFRTLLRYYESGKLCKPEIQRDYVWKSKQITSLLNSLYKDYPIGLILLWEPPDENHLKPLEFQPKLENPTLAIIDGQQRLTSLHITKKKEKPVLFNWYTEEFKMQSSKTKSDPHLKLVSEIWDSSFNQHKFEHDLPTKYTYEQLEKISSNITKLKKILDIEPDTKTIRDMDYDKITQIFIALNKNGRPIQPDEILFAYGILKFPKIFGKKLNDLTQQYIKWNITGKRTGPKKFFIQALACIATQQSKLKDVSDTMENYLHNNNEPQLKKDFDNVENGLAYTITFLTDVFGINDINNRQLLPSVYPLLLILSFFVNKSFSLDSDEKELLKLWTFLAMHHGRYSGSSETTLNEDLRTLYNNPSLGSIEIIKEWITKIKKDKGGSLEVRDLGSALNPTNYFTLFFALDFAKAKDWLSHFSIRNLPNIEFHHIFPKNFLKKHHISKSKINDPRNIAIISQKVNRKIKDKSPSQYFQDKNIIYSKDQIYTQFIPTDSSLLDINNYEKFKSKREKLIKDKLNKYIKDLEKQFNL